jgi:predicted metal-dependent hydrolase
MEKNLKEVPANKQKSLGKLPTDVRNKMGYAKKGTMMKAKKGKMTKTIHSTDHPDVKMTQKLYAKNKIYAGSKEEIAKNLDEIQNKIAKKRTKTEGSFSMGGEMKQGYGAARTSGMGLQDEDLIPGKSMDYYKDLM